MHPLRISVFAPAAPLLGATCALYPASLGESLSPLLKKAFFPWGSPNIQVELGTPSSVFPLFSPRTQGRGHYSGLLWWEENSLLLKTKAKRGNAPQTLKNKESMVKVEGNWARNQHLERVGGASPSPVPRCTWHGARTQMARPPSA